MVVGWIELACSRARTGVVALAVYGAVALAPAAVACAWRLTRPARARLADDDHRRLVGGATNWRGTRVPCGLCTAAAHGRTYAAAWVKRAEKQHLRPSSRDDH